jgi:hypothetical protein
MLGPCTEADESAGRAERDRNVAVGTRHATQRRDRAGQPEPTEHEVDSMFAPGGPRSAEKKWGHVQY